MKNARKLTSILVLIAMLFMIAAPAMAEGEDGYTITINNNTPGHTYEAYQIFAGDLSSEGVLSNIVWGSGVSNDAAAPDNLGDAAAKAESLSTTAAAEDFAKSLKQYLQNPVESTYDSANEVYTISGLDAGYYLIKDKDNSLDSDEYDAYTAFILKVVKNTEATPKSAKPEVDKQVLDEEDDAEATAKDGWGETADHAINESFQFKLTATLPEDVNLAAYETYEVVFHDTMSDGVTFDSIESVKVGTTDVTGYTCTATAGQEGGEWTLTIADLKAFQADLTSGATVEVIYNAHLNENAVVGNHDDNKNTVYLEYSNNPNADGKGKTKEDTVWVFTYEVDNTKMNGDTDTPLAGAGFRLYTDEDCTNEVALIYDATLEAYRPVKTGENGENGEEMISAETTGKFNIKGLDAGTYYLKETKTPSGFNTCENIEIVITATHAESSNTTTATTTITMKQDGSDATAITVENNSGATLPETGGIGTTIFYVVGAALVVGAGVLLVTKKRMTGQR